MVSSSSSSAIPIITDQAKISSFNRGLLSTIFVPPPSCLSTFTFVNSMYFGHQPEGYVDTDFYPIGTIRGGAWDVYYCWSEATKPISSFGRGGTLLNIGAATTAVICWPSGFNYKTDGHVCVSPIVKKTSSLIYISPSLDRQEWALTNANSPLTTAAGSPYTAFGDGIPIWYQSSDAKAFFLAATITSIFTTPSIPAITLINSSNAIDPTTSDKSVSGLSMGTKVAVAVSTSILIIALAIGTAMYLIRKLKGKRPGRGSSAPMTDDAIMSPEHRKGLGNEGAVSELFVDHGDVRAGDMIVGTVGDEEVGGNQTPGEGRENKVDVRVTELPG